MYFNYPGFSEISQWHCGACAISKHPGTDCDRGNCRNVRRWGGGSKAHRAAFPFSSPRLLKAGAATPWPGSFPHWAGCVKIRVPVRWPSPTPKLEFIFKVARKGNEFVWFENSCQQKLGWNGRKMSQRPAPKSINTPTQAKCSSSWAILPLLPRKEVLQQM